MFRYIYSFSSLPEAWHGKQAKCPNHISDSRYFHGISVNFSWEKPSKTGWILAPCWVKHIYPWNCWKAALQAYQAWSVLWHSWSCLWDLPVIGACVCCSSRRNIPRSTGAGSQRRRRKRCSWRTNPPSNSPCWASGNPNFGASGIDFTPPEPFLPAGRLRDSPKELLQEFGGGCAVEGGNVYMDTVLWKVPKYLFFVQILWNNF